MNYYEKEIERARNNFNFSMKIYSGNSLLQRTLCVQMMARLDKMWFPKELTGLYPKKKQLYREILNVYCGLVGNKIG